MLITELKSKDEILPCLNGKVFVINCRGCSEVFFPEEEISAFQEELPVSAALNTAYICRAEQLKEQLSCYEKVLEEADTVLVFSCGVGVQTVSRALEEKKVCAGCNTQIISGHAGLTPTQSDCQRCGECYLNLTGGICPVTACAKGLVNGQCGGAKNGKCEVDPTMDCGWERIHKKLEAAKGCGAVSAPVQMRNFSANKEIK